MVEHNLEDSFEVVPYDEPEAGSGWEISACFASRADIVVNSNYVSEWESENNISY